MREVQLGTITQFHCHIGHIMTAEVLAAAKLEMLQNDISTCVGAANERTELCREIARKHDARGDTGAVQLWRRASDEAGRRAQLLAELAETEWMNPEHAPETAADAAVSG